MFYVDVVMCMCRRQLMTDAWMKLKRYRNCFHGLLTFGLNYANIALAERRVRGFSNSRSIARHICLYEIFPVLKRLIWRRTLRRVAMIASGCLWFSEQTCEMKL